MDTNKVKKVAMKRGKRSESSHRIWVTFSDHVYSALLKRSKELGYTVGALTRRTIDRAVVCGLLDDDLPSLRGADVVSKPLVDEYVQVTQNNQRGDAERIRLLTKLVDLQQRRLDQLQQQVDNHGEVILRQAVEIAIYETDGFNAVNEIKQPEMIDSLPF